MNIGIDEINIRHGPTFSHVLMGRWGILWYCQITHERSGYNRPQKTQKLVDN